MKVVTTALLGLFILASTAMGQTKEPPPQIKPKDVVEVPFCSVAKDRKLDPKSKGIFDELKVAVTTGRETRIRISGKKNEEAGSLEGQPVLHSGKAALIPVAARKGSLTAKLPEVADVRYYYMCLELADNKMKTEHIKMEKGAIYTWTVEIADGQTTFTIFDPTSKVLATLRGAEKEVRAFGFAATVRWKGNEADLAATIEG